MDEKFWSRVDRGSADDCWAWQGFIDQKGYGRYQPTGGRLAQAHRFAYESAVGPIPDGLVIDHLCRNRGCCNPAHLEPVTNRENILRGVGLSAMHSRKTHCVHGHELTGANVLVKYRGGLPSRTCRQCGTVNRRRQTLRDAAARAALDAKGPGQ